jgi:poly(3-hydroxybutyrate) depolymerase
MHKTRERSATFLFAALAGAFLLVGCDAGGGTTPGAGAGAAGTGGTPTGTAGTTTGTGGDKGAGTAGASGGDTGAGPAGTTGAAGAIGTAGASGAAGTTGTAGTTGAGGTTSAGGVGGAGGATSTGGTVGTGAPPKGMSAGCGKANADSPKAWVQHNVMPAVAAAYSPAYSMRKYFTMVPPGYDPTKAYPVTMWGPGCGASGAESNQLQGSGHTSEYIQVFLLQQTSCFSTGKADSPEVPYFDSVLADLENNFCVDKSKIFVAGYSSGSWLTHLLGCQRGNVIRGIGSASGGILVDHGTCTGPIAGIFTGDSSDTTNPIVNVDKTTMIDKGSGAARDRVLKANGCSLTMTQPWDGGIAGCSAYQGCMTGYPVVWCLTMGMGHSNGANVSAVGFWKFWSALPSL